MTEISGEPEVRDWVIYVGGGYGLFLYKGTEEEAELMRSHKANWERAVALKRLATPVEVREDKADECLNHYLYPHIQNNKFRYACPCDKCVAAKAKPAQETA